MRIIALNIDLQLLLQANFVFLIEKLRDGLFYIFQMLIVDFSCFLLLTIIYNFIALFVNFFNKQ